MSNRVARVNELIQREISAYLRKHYASELVAVTVTGVEVTPDFDLGTVFISVIGGEDVVAGKLKFLRRRSEEVRRHVGRHVVLHATPHLRWRLDDTPQRAARIEQILAEIDQRETRDQPGTPS